MPHFWTINAEGEWGIQPLAGECRLALSAGPGLCLTPPAGPPGLEDALVFPAEAAGASPTWALMAGRRAALRVNGLLLVLGIRALRDRDEIAFDGQRSFFSTEELAHIVPFPGLAQTASCPRCKQKVEPGDPAVACPHCHAWHHQSEKYPCWTYGATCALCQLQSTALDAGYSWSPEKL